MNREIKFRAWDIRNKKYYQPVFIAETEVHAYIGHYGLDCVGDVSEFIIEQYTGLKDKNGKEIYEGDRVRFYEEYDGKILYRIGGFFFEEENGRHTPLQLLNPIACEVIGNIHDKVSK